MRWSRLAVAAVLVAGACTDASLPTADTELPIPPMASSISDANTGGNPDFYLLPPLVGDVTPTGVFNGDLAPVVSICQVATLAQLDAANGNKPLSDREIRDFLDDEASLQCPEEVRRLARADLKVSPDAYQVNWDTDSGLNPGLEDGDFVRLRVFLSEADRRAWDEAANPFASVPGSAPLGYIDLFAADPSGNSPSEDQVGLYAFRLGEKIPVKFWISEGIVCDPDQGEVAECTELAWDDNVGVSGFLDQGDRIGFSCAAECRTGDQDPDNFETVTLVIERLKLKRDFPNDPEALDDCIDGLVLATSGPCLRLSTRPELAVAEPVLVVGGEVVLDAPGVIAICADLSAFGPPGENAQIVRQSDDGQEVQFLANAPTPLCPEVVGLRPDAFGDGALARLAARTLNGVVRFVGPDPLVAGDFVGGLSRRLSNFQWAVPCRLGYPGGVAGDAGDGQFGRAGTALADPLGIQCLDEDGQGVNGARIRFRTSTGSVDVSGDAVDADQDGFYLVTGTDAGGNDGRASWSWAPSERGVNELEAFGLGLLGPGDDFPVHCYVVEGTPEALETDECVVVTEAELEGGANGEVIQTDLPTGSLAYSATVSGDPADITTTFTFGEATVGSTLGPIDMKVNDAVTGEVFGVPGETVTWSVTDGGCLLIDEDGDPGTDPQEYCSEPDGMGGFTTVTVTTVTGSDGTTRATWRIGTASGTQSLTVSAGEITETFDVNATPDAPASLTIVAGNGQTADAGTTLPTDLAVLAKDQYGNDATNAAAGGFTVAWNALDGGGSLSPASASIDGSGQASSSWTLGSAIGTQSASAQLVGATGGNVGSPVLFTATATCVEASGLGSVDVTDGVKDEDWACAKSRSFTANVGNGGAPATFYWMDDGENLYLAVEVEAVNNRVNSLRFDFTENLPFGVQEGDVVTTVDAAQFDDVLEFDPELGAAGVSDEYLTAQCANSNQAGCSETDLSAGGVNDGLGGFGQPNRTTFYEVSKPLTGDDPLDFGIAQGDALGLYLSLTLGNGAKGNTQWPQFREYLVITAKGAASAVTQE